MFNIRAKNCISEKNEEIHLSRKRSGKNSYNTEKRSASARKIKRCRHVSFLLFSGVDIAAFIAIFKVFLKVFWPNLAEKGGFLQTFGSKFFKHLKKKFRTR